MESIADKKIYEPYIDGLRGLAILSVLGVHLPLGATKFTIPGFQGVIEAGARGVQLFFLLSAFTLFRSSKSKYEIETSPRRNFYIRRFFRILPLWWVCIGLYTLLNNHSLASSLPSHLMYFGFIRYDVNNEVFPMGWSIFVEETFYLFLPVIFIYINSLKRSIIFYTMLALLSTIWIKFAVQMGVPSGNFFISLFPISQWPCLALGVVIFYASTHKYFINTILPNILIMRLFDLSAIILIIILYKKNFMVMTIPLSLIFVSSISEHTFFGRVTRNRMVKQFGICCYSIYLFHFLLIKYLEPVRVWFQSALCNIITPGEVLFVIWYFVFALINLIFGIICYNIIELPLVNVGKKIISQIEK